MHTDPDYAQPVESDHEQADAELVETLELANHTVSRWTPEGSLRTHPCGACGARSLAGCGFPDSCPIERT